jgi:hypothetical protein
VARQLQTNSDYVWEQVVQVQKKVDVYDGWGHPGDSVEELRRELKGMMEGDKHEQVMEAWAKQMAAEDEEKRKRLEEARKKRGMEGAGVYQGSVVVVSDKEIKERQNALARGEKPAAKQATTRQQHEISATARQLDKIKKYR